MSGQIKSVSDDQKYIIKSIMQLCGVDRFDADVTYGNGVFWKDLPEPKYAFDIAPQMTGVVQASSVQLPVADAAFRSMMFDPPFLTYIKSGREHGSIMGKRFSGYWTYAELENHYRATLKESARCLRKGGVLVVKCQDIIHNHTMHPTHINIAQWMQSWFRLKDLFVLTAKHRLPMPSKEGEAARKQKHARVYHSYFMVLEKL